MAHSNAVLFGGLKVFFVQVGLLFVGAFSVLILFSFGGLVVAAPVLLPVQWIIARDTSGWVSTTFSVLGAVLLGEVLYLVFTITVGESPAARVLGVLLALGGAYVFFRTSRRAGRG